MKIIKVNKIGPISLAFIVSLLLSGCYQHPHLSRVHESSFLDKTMLSHAAN